MSKPKILLIDDSEDIHQLVIKTLSDICHVFSAHTFSEGRKKFESDEYDIVIIDLSLEDMNGMDLLKEFKSHPTKTRFFIMTGKDSVNDELLGHGYGVHEYLKKPMNREVLKAIVQKNLKIRQHDAPAELKVAPFEIYPDQFKVFGLGPAGEKTEFQLTIKEFQILVKLVSSPDKPFSRQELFNQIWESHSDSTFRTIDMHVSSLRKKLGTYGSTIKTVHQIGYKFQA